MIETVVLGWDEKAFILQQRFLKGGDCVAEGIVRARILKRSGGSGSVPPAKVLALSGIASPSPSLPSWIDAWNVRQAE